MNQIVLRGCTSEPLGSYLKSLAVLRLIFEQKDHNARGRWIDGVFCLETNLTENELVQFFMENYSPTPIVAPWNGGSGFYDGDDKAGLEAIRSSDSPRFDAYRRTILEILLWPEMPSSGLKIGTMIDNLEQVAIEKKGKTQEKLLEPLNEIKTKLSEIATLLTPQDPRSLTIEELEVKSKISPSIRETVRLAKKIRTQFKSMARSAGKEFIIQACRDKLHPRMVEWMDAAVIIGPTGELEYPPILGSGGNEGRFDYTNTFMNNIRNLLIEKGNNEVSITLLRNALFGETASGFSNSSVGYFDPGRAGGYNQGFGIERKNFPTNPWNFVLTLEGAVVWASSIGKRNAVGGRRFLRSPFTVRAKAVGYSSSSLNDETNARAELWAPLWSRPLGIKELRAFLGEGRSDVGRRPAGNSIEFAEAVSSLSIDRGVTEFVRYSLLKRRGDSYIALPAGRFPVKMRRESDLIRELDPILQRLDSFLRKFKQVPAEFANARRNIDSATYDVLLHGGATRVKHLLIAIGQMEQLIAKRDPTRDPKLKYPLSGLSPRWIVGADDDSLEIRIAAALGSVGATDKIGTIRANLEPVDPKKPYLWKTTEEQTAWSGNTFATRLSNVLYRRMMDVQRLNCRSNPVRAEIRLKNEDIVSFIDGDSDDSMVQDLLFGLMWIRWDNRDLVHMIRDMLKERWALPITNKLVPRSWSLLKLLFLPEDIRSSGKEPVSVKPEPSIIPLLKAGRIGDACEVARKRLYSTGLLPVEAIFPDSENGERIAAALLLPVRSERALTRLVLNEKM